MGPVAVTGARGRLGRALVEELRQRAVETAEWIRPDYDLDDAGSAAWVVGRDRPRLVIHCAAWTDVDGCATDPDAAMRRNAAAVGALAAACADAGADLVVVSTNEVFDGRRGDGRPYAEDDPVAPVNPYGASKLAGEHAASEAFAAGAGAAGGARLWIVRTSWLFGPPGNDFPTKILAAADRLAPGEPLGVADDEHGSPTYTVDLAPALLELIERAPAGTYHLAGGGAASRYEFAREILRVCRPGVELERITRLEFERSSTPPAWGVLDTSRAATFGVEMRPWTEALARYLADLC